MKSFLLFLLLSLSLLSSNCQDSTLLITPFQFSNDLSLENQGKVTFMEGYIPFENYSVDDFLHETALTESSDLVGRLFLAKPLTHYLHDLESSLGVKELCMYGNLQFDFTVDGKFVYSHKMDPYGGDCNFKNTSPAFLIIFQGMEGQGHWGKFIWREFLMNGGRDALLSGAHELLIEVRPHINYEEAISGEVISKGQIAINSTLEELIISPEEIAIQEIKNHEDWTLSNSTFKQETIKELNEQIAVGRFSEITSIVVVKNGELLIEEYFNNSNRDDLQDTRSVGKSLMSAMMGIAIDKGYIQDEHQNLSKFYDLTTYDNYSSSKDAVTLRSMLSMSSGFQGDDNDYNNPGNENNMYDLPDWIKFALDQPMDEKETIGKNWKYFTAGSVVLGDVINKSVPNGLEKFAETHFFQPMNIEEHQWQYTPMNVPSTAGGLALKSLDLAKFGQMYKDGGIWKGKSIVSKDWVDKSLTKHIELPENYNGYYGYQFWNKTFEVDGNMYEAWYCTGNGGNKIYIFKDVPFVVVVTATAYGTAYAHVQVKKMMEDYILPAIL